MEARKRNTDGTFAALHGMTRSPTWVAWRSMRKRAAGAGTASPDAYTDVTVCARWSEFENFLADMGVRPDGLSLDRIDCAGNYEPSNCRWATALEQNRNKRNMKLSENMAADIRSLVGLMSQTRIADLYGVSRTMISAIHTGRTWKLEERA